MLEQDDLSYFRMIISENRFPFSGSCSVANQPNDVTPPRHRPDAAQQRKHP